MLKYYRFINKYKKCIQQIILRWYIGNRIKNNLKIFDLKVKNKFKFCNNYLFIFFLFI